MRTPITITPGQSGYFSEPEDHLDPHLFAGDGNSGLPHIRPEVRFLIVDKLSQFWKDHQFHDPAAWQHVWIAGSGASYQWSAARGNGDLDVLIGIDYRNFVAANDDYASATEEEIATYLTHMLRADIWPRTAQTDINGQTYEVTYFVNPADDIRRINPYAAYDLIQDTWTVAPTPQHAPVNTAFEATAELDTEHVHRLVDQYNHTLDDLNSANTESALYYNSLERLNAIDEQARREFINIHAGRSAAFSPGGAGYADFANYRWQHAKREGLLDALKQIAPPEKTADSVHDLILGAQLHAQRYQHTEL